MMVTPTISIAPDCCWNTTTFPAMVFLTTGYIGLGREFWWDELGNNCCSSQIAVAGSSAVDINGTMFQWELADAADHPR